MEQYNVTGMSCAACSARVEKAVSKVPGVTSCSVSLLTNSMGVEGTAAPADIVAAVEAAGYGASPKNAAAQSAAPSADALKVTETPRLKRRLIASLIFWVVLMYFSMGHMLWNWPLPGFMQGNHVAMGILQMLLTIIIMVINQKFFISGFKALWNRAPNMDTLVSLGATAAFGYSTYALFAMTVAQVQGDAMAVMGYMEEFYFESAATILTLITVGKTLEARSKGKTTDALKGLMNLAPKTATLLRNGAEVTVPIEQVQQGDVASVEKNLKSGQYRHIAMKTRLSTDLVQNFRYHCIISLAMVTRFCIEGGMPGEQAYRMSDFYIHKVDEVTTIDLVEELHDAACMDYAKRMQQIKNKPVCSKPVTLCLNYIYAHMHEKITTEDLAEEVHLHPSYLSRLFREQMGCTLHDYILDQKIQTAKQMLSLIHI